MGIECYSVGGVIEQFKNSYPGCMFDITENGGILFVCMDSENIKKYSIGGHYDFAFVPIVNTIFLCFKCDNMPWSSAPYSPHLSASFEPVAYPEGKGMPLSILQVCCEDGRIHAMDFLVLGNEFSNMLHRTADILMGMEFSRQEQSQVINAVYSKYPTDEELAEICEYRYSID